MILNSDFYARGTLTVTQELLGSYLCYQSEEGLLVGKILETEAYVKNDPAAHSYKGLTQRTVALFGNPGTIYIYLIYGMYYCFNVVTGRQGEGEAVLIRALEPIQGIEIMQRNRKKETLKDLCSGPGKLVSAFAIPKSLNNTMVTHPPLYIVSRDHFGAYEDFETVTTTRVGITQAAELPYRFYIKDSLFVSRK